MTKSQTCEECKGEDYAYSKYIDATACSDHVWYFFDWAVRVYMYAMLLLALCMGLAFSGDIYKYIRESKFCRKFCRCCDGKTNEPKSEKVFFTEDILEKINRNENRYVKNGGKRIYYKDQ